MILLLEDVEDRTAVDRALVDYQQGTTVPGEVVHAVLDGVSPLRAWRKSRGFTLERLAQGAGVSKSYLSQIENNLKPGSLNLYRQISIILDVSVDDLIDWKEGGVSPGVDAI